MSLAAGTAAEGLNGRDPDAADAVELRSKVWYFNISPTLPKQD
jgi:hypothetical protein